ncbi:MAG: carbohydrate kinase [Anaerolineales bacterium]|nr:carbohydrate kinase [Anaerolineales bacterium]
MEIVTLGELLIDMFPMKVGQAMGEVEAFTPKPGGAPANVAVAARRLGRKSAFIGKVGEDLFGTYLKEVLDKEGVDTRGLHFDPEARTTMAIIAMPDENSAEFVFYRNPGADHRLEADELDSSLLAETKVFHFGSLSLTDEPARTATLEAVKLAKEAGALISYDLNYRPALWKNPDEALIEAEKMLPLVDVLKVNEEEVALLCGVASVSLADRDGLADATGQILGRGPTLVVVTFGSQGSYFRFAGGGGYVPGFKVDTIDAVGCGDAFTAGMLSQLVEMPDWRAELSETRLSEILTFANAVGALTSLKRGVITALPYLNEVNQFLDERNDYER